MSQGTREEERGRREGRRRRNGREGRKGGREGEEIDSTRERDMQTAERHACNACMNAGRQAHRERHTAGWAEAMSDKAAARQTAI